MLVVNMANQDQTLKNNIGGASESVPRLSPIFYYEIAGGEEIRVYVAQTSISGFAVISLINRRGEIFYSVRSLSLPSSFIVHDLVTEAFQEYEMLGYEENPFDILQSDIVMIEALERTINAYQKKLSGEEA